MIEQSIKPEKRTLDPVATKKKILEASVDLFSRYGYHSVSFAQIAEATSLPKSLVAYHFGTKEELWASVTSHLMKPGLESMDRFLSGEISVAELLKTRLKLISESPTRSRFIAWASLTDVNPPPQLLARREQLRKRIFDVEPEVLSGCLLAISLMDGWYLNRKTYELLLGEKATQLVTDERIRHEVAKLIPAGKETGL